MTEETERQTDVQTCREREKETDIQISRYTEKERETGRQTDITDILIHRNEKKDKQKY